MVKIAWFWGWTWELPKPKKRYFNLVIMLDLLHAKKAALKQQISV